jgi:flagellar biosynthesis/type III secretory pathway M-ring protein FliF/YscJ
MIIALALLGAAVVFLSIVVAILYWQIVRPMREQMNERITLHASQEVEAISRRADEIALMDKTNHLDVRGHIVRLSRRVEELEIVTFDRPTKVSA